MEPVPPAPRPPGDEVVVRGTRPPLTQAGVVVVLGLLLGVAWVTAQASPWLAVFGAAGAITMGYVALRAGLIGLGWQAPELTLPPGPLLLGSRTEVTYRRRPRRPHRSKEGRLKATLVCEERVIVGQGKYQTTRTAFAVRHLIDTPLTVGPAGVEASFWIEIPLVAGAPTMHITSAKAVVWRVEASLEGDDLPRDEQQFRLEVAPVISPAWFDQRSPR